VPRFVETATDRCAQFQEFWSDLPKSGLLPHSRDFLGAPEPALIPHVYIMELSDDGPLIRFMGTALVTLHGRDLTGQLFAEGLPTTIRDPLTHNCSNVAAHPCGLLELAEFKSATGRPFQMETVMLPLAVDEGRMSRVCTFSSILEDLHNEDRDSISFQGRQEPGWFDIGAGCPNTSLRYPDPTSTESP